MLEDGLLSLALSVVNFISENNAPGILLRCQSPLILHQMEAISQVTTRFR